ncbi:hypothetical protein MASR1M32_36200 [Rhodobacter sp.]
MKAIVPSLSLLVLTAAACVSAEGSVQTVDGRALRVTQVEDYYWPASPAANPEVEVFPLVTALVVGAADGSALGRSDESAARAAATAHCAALGTAAYAPSSRLAEGAWAFSPC